MQVGPKGPGEEDLKEVCITCCVVLISTLSCTVKLESILSPGQYYSQSYLTTLEIVYSQYPLKLSTLFAVPGTIMQWQRAKEEP